VQPVDLTTLTAACCELRTAWLPARVEQTYQRDRFTLSLAVRTLDRRGWLTVSWHPQAARLCADDPPPRDPDTFAFSDQLRHQLKGLALVAIAPIDPWERVLDLQFSRRPGDTILWHLYAEIMGKYSNLILVDKDDRIVTAAHQVSEKQSSVRPILTGQTYEMPPGLTEAVPSLEEPFDRWRDRVALVPGDIRRNLLKNYRGVSSSLILSMLSEVGIDGKTSTDDLGEKEWQQLHQKWCEWLQALEKQTFDPGFTNEGYTVLGWGITKPSDSVQDILNRYYTDELNAQTFKQLRHQLSQKLATLLKKLKVKRDDFLSRLQDSDRADEYRAKADLLMAYLHEWQPGMNQITLSDFETNQPIEISLNPEKNAVQNAQTLYKRHQKLKRSRQAIEPLLAEVNAEIYYLEQIEAALDRIPTYDRPEDLWALEEIRDELIDRAYLPPPQHYRRSRERSEGTPFRRYATPGGFEVWVGRNNQQNDKLTFRVAGDYDLWFHAQEIPGSHVLLRLQPGSVPDNTDLQFSADVAAYYSRASQSDRVPIVYTEPRNVYKPKGAQPGIAIYKKERIVWGEPGAIEAMKS